MTDDKPRNDEPRIGSPEWIAKVEGRQRIRNESQARNLEARARGYLELDKESGDARYFIGGSHLLRKKYEEAEIEFKAALEGNRKDITGYEILQKLGLLSNERGDYETGARYLALSIETGVREGVYCTGIGDLPSDILSLLHLLTNAGMKDKAREVFLESGHLIDEEFRKGFEEELEVKLQ